MPEKASRSGHPHRADATAAPGVHQPALVVAQRLVDEGEGAARRIEAGRGEGEARRARQGGDHQPVPIGEDFVVQAGLWPLIA